jgi:hypothetical protein
MIKYLVREYKKGGNNIFDVMIKHKDEWKFLLLKDNKFVVSKRTSMKFDSFSGVMKFISSNRVLYGRDRGVDRYTFSYYNPMYSFIPFFGLYYFMINYFKNETGIEILIPYEKRKRILLFSLFVLIQSMSILFILFSAMEFI